MHGLKNVRNRRTDALTHVGWDQLETMLAVYYRGQGFRVEHVGTGGSGTRFDGGIDLKLYKEDAYIVVQCKHWNAKQVTHNAVHELLGVMVTQGATGAILVTSGEFTRAAIEAATKQGHVQLVDGDDLREMLGPLREVAPVASSVSDGTSSVAGDIAAQVGARLLGAAEDRIRGGGRGQRRRGFVGNAMDAGMGIVLLKLLVGLVLFLSLTGGINWVLRPIQEALGSGAVETPPRNSLPVPQQTPGTAVLQARYPSGHPPLEAGPAGVPAQADEAMRILEASTPEM
ncbi:MAG: restriction endonuclease [Pseudomonadota bacterium]|nr:restriction endonuclease [Pseudomonadota bacterium]